MLVVQGVPCQRFRASAGALIANRDEVAVRIVSRHWVCACAERPYKLHTTAGRMSISPPSTARGSQVLLFEGAIPHEVAPEPPAHPLDASTGQAAEPAQGQGPPSLAPNAAQGIAQAVVSQPAASSSAPAGALPAHSLTWHIQPVVAGHSWLMTENL